MYFGWEGHENCERRRYSTAKQVTLAELFKDNWSITLESKTSGNRGDSHTQQINDDFLTIQNSLFFIFSLARCFSALFKRNESMWKILIFHAKAKN